jgi:hypothetical protein
MLKIFGPPNMVVIDRDRRYAPIHFDANGEAVVPDTPFTRRVMSYYPQKSEAKTPDSVPETAQEPVYRCKKCDYTTANKGELMAHYRAHKAKGD